MSNPQLTAQISGELYRILELFGAKSDLLKIVGSYGDTMEDEWVLTELRRWRELKDLANDAK